MIGKILILLCFTIVLSSCSRVNQNVDNSVASEYIEATGIDEDIQYYISDDDAIDDYEYAIATNVEQFVDDEQVTDEKQVNDDTELAYETEDNTDVTIRRYARKFTIDFGSSLREKGGIGIVTWWSDSTEPARYYEVGSERYFFVHTMLDGSVEIEGDHLGLAGEVIDLTTHQWEEWGVQILSFAGDKILLGGRGSLTSIPEFHEDNFYFPLETDERYVYPHDGARREFEMQYIISHEMSESALLQLIMPSLHESSHGSVYPIINYEKSVADDDVSADNDNIDDISIARRYARKFTIHFGSSLREKGGVGIVTWWSDSTEPARYYEVGSERYFLVHTMPDGSVEIEGYHLGLAGEVLDVTTHQWEECGIQILSFAGDKILLGGRGSLTSIPEFHEDDFYFPLETDEKYIYYMKPKNE